MVPQIDLRTREGKKICYKNDFEFATAVVLNKYNNLSFDWGGGELSTFFLRIWSLGHKTVDTLVRKFGYILPCKKNQNICLFHYFHK